MLENLTSYEKDMLYRIYELLHGNQKMDLRE